jgi:regulator of protease activity HflC (stomatin/prohibitin superfamily)
MGKRKAMLPTAAWFVSAFGEESEERRRAEAELRAAEAVIQAARSDPDPHHRVAKALARFDRVTGRGHG